MIESVSIFATTVNHCPNQFIQIGRTFGKDYIFTRNQEFFFRTRLQGNELIAQEAGSPDRRHRINGELKIRGQIEFDARPQIRIEFDGGDPPHTDTADPDGRSIGKATNIIEGRKEGQPALVLQGEASNLEREIRQGQDSDQNEYPDDEITSR